MKYRVKNAESDSKDEFEVSDFRLLEARTRSRLATVMVIAWLIVLLAMLIVAIRTGDRGTLQKALDTATYFVATGFGWYFRGRQRE